MTNDQDDDPQSHFMIQSSQQVRSTAECCQIYRKSSLAGWAAVLGFAALTLGPFGLATHPPNWTHPPNATHSAPAILDSDKIDG